MPHLLACPAPPKREVAEAPKPGGFAAEFAAAPPKRTAFAAKSQGDLRGVAPAPRRVVFVVRGRPGPTDRPALPPGSPESWGAITDNTVLHHAPYPFPVFPACR